MKRLIAFFLLIQLIQLPAKAQKAGQRGVQFFPGTFGEALAKAKAEKKLLFLDCYTTWCGPCKLMASNVFTNDTVGGSFNRLFICYKLDMEKGEGIQIAKKYAVKNYPTYLWIDSTGKQIHRSVGSVTVRHFIKIATNAISKENNLAYLEELYNSGNRNPDKLLAYAYVLKDAYITAYQTVADDYFHTQPEEALSNETNWKTLLEFTPNLNSYVCNTIIKKPVPFYEHYGKDSVENTLDNLALESIHYASQYNDSALLDKATSRLKLSKNKDMVKESARGELGFYKLNDRLPKYTALAPAYAAAHFWDDAKALNEISWTYFMRVMDKAKLAEAENWIAQSVKLDDSYYNTDTYANILHKVGKNKEALAMTKHSIELAKKSNQDCTSTKELLDTLVKEKGAAKSK